MRTTLDLNDVLVRKARREAQSRRTSLTAVIEDALRRYFLAEKSTVALPVMQRWIIVQGDKPPRVDVADRNELYEVMERDS